LSQQTQQSQQSQQPKPAKKRWKDSESRIRGNNIICGGLLAIFLIIVQAFIQIGLHNLCSYIIVVSLAVSGPCLAAIIYINSSHHTRFPYKRSGKFFNMIYGFGMLSGFVGLAATFWYMSWIVGAVFLVASLIVFVLSILYVNQLSQDEDGHYMWR
jgi:hypothetical protein